MEMSNVYDDLYRRIEELERRVYACNMYEYIRRTRDHDICMAIDSSNNRSYYAPNDGHIQYPCEKGEIAVVGSLLYIGHDIVVDTSYPFTVHDGCIVLRDGSTIPIPTREQAIAIRRMFKV
jgi:hypothetical protein